MYDIFVILGNFSNHAKAFSLINLIFVSCSLRVALMGIA